jgi:hypothetical protein
MKGLMILGLAVLLPAFVFAGGRTQGSSGGGGTTPAEITVISRVDKTAKEAVISNRTDIMFSAGEDTKEV